MGLRGTGDSEEAVTSADAVLPTSSESSSTLPEPMGRFVNVPISDLFLIEVCAGTARLSKAAARLGFQAMPVDCSKARATGVQIFIFDLCSEDQLRDLFRVLDVHANRIALIFCAPPCGTASRAREKPIPGVANPPAPLRSTLWPDGLPGLDYADKLKTELANQVYDAIAKITLWAARRQVEIVVENPLRSYMWETSFFAPAAEHLPEHIVYQACMHGGGRDKFTLLRASSEMLEPLAVLCDGSHRHQPWQPKSVGGKLLFPTHEEAAYPHLLCERIVGCLFQWCLQQGAHLCSTLPQQMHSGSPVTSRLVLNALPRSAKLKPMVKEHGRFLALQGFNQQELFAFLSKLPKGSRIVSRHQMGESEAGDKFEHMYAAYSPLLPVHVKQQGWALQQCGVSKVTVHEAAAGYNPEWLQLAHDPMAVEKPGVCSSRAERLAGEILKRGYISYDSALEMMELLPAECGARSSGWAPSEKSWTTGAYVHGGIVAVRKHCRQYNNVTMLLCAILKAAHPGMPFSSAALFLDTKTPMHRDQNNLESCPNLVVPLSVFSDGQIWVANAGEKPSVSGPSRAEGDLLEVAGGPCRFDASRYHCTMDWRGRRLVLVGFHVRDHDKLSVKDAAVLTGLGFPLERTHSDGRNGQRGRAGEEVCVVGVPSLPAEFVSRVVEAGHPKDLQRHSSDISRQAVEANFISPPFEVAKLRVETIKRWTARASELDAEEKRANAKRPQHMQSLLRNKRLLLMRDLLTELDYPDVAVVHDIEQGFPLHGWLPSSGVFEAKARRPSFSLDTLKLMSKSFSAAVYKRLGNRQEESLEKETWEETRQELTKGWLWTEAGGAEAGARVLAMRFGLRQKNKLRVIDDCSVGGLNGTVGLPEKLRVHSIDVLLNMMIDAFKARGDLTFPPSVGRTFDLKAAYRQFGISTSSRDLLRIVVNDGDSGKPMALGVNTLPFGAVGSVAGFLRVSMAVWFIGIAALRICWTAFYDDFTTFCRKELIKSTEWAITSLFRLLGLEFATEGQKAPDFSTVFRSLGLQVDLTDAAGKVVRVGHTPERREELAATIKEHLSKREMTAREAEQLRGRMVFFEGFAFGRAANQALKQVSLRAESQGDQNSLDESLSRALEVILLRIQAATPLELSAQSADTFFIFTDGAFEDGKGSIGGILYDASGKPLDFFALELEPEAMEPFLADSRNPIYELELLPVAISFWLWAKRLKHKQLVCYLDNDAARAALIRGTGGTILADNIVHHAMLYETEQALLSWFARVPSASNPADDPSRMQFEHLLHAGAVRVSVSQELVTSLCARHAG